MNPRTWARIVIASAFFLLGLAETLTSTGLIIEFLPDAPWGLGTHILVIGGPLQMAAATLLASGRKTRWALGILLCYVSLGIVFGNLPQIFDPASGGSAIAHLLSRTAVVGGLLYWLHRERTTRRRVLPVSGLTGRSLHRDQPFAYARGFSETQPAGGNRREAAN